MGYVGSRPDHMSLDAIGGSIKHSGRVRPIFRWVPNQPNGLPTGKLRYIFTVRARGSANSNNKYWSLQESLADRNASKEHVTAEILGQSLEGKDIDYVTQINTTIDKPMALDVSQMTSDNLLEGDWLDMSIEAKLDGNRYSVGGMFSSSLPGAVSASLGLSSAPDDHRVVVSRVGAPPAKAENDPTLDKDHDEWTDSEGYGHGHSRWSYSGYNNIGSPGEPNYTTQPQIVSHSFIATPTGTDWSPYAQLSGNWSPSDSRDQVPPSGTPGNPHSHTQDMKDGGGILSNEAEGVYPDEDLKFGWNKEPKAKGDQEITYVLRDTAKGKQSSGQYFLTLHNEWDNGRRGPLPNQVFNTEYPVKTNGVVTWYHDNQAHKFGGKVTHAWKVTLGIKLKTMNLFGTIPEAEGSFSGEYGGSKDYTVESTISQTTAPGMHRYFYVNIHEEQKHYLVDHFGANGFLGSEDVWLPYGRASGYEAGFSAEYPDDDYITRDHHGSNDLVDQNGDYTELETPQP